MKKDGNRPFIKWPGGKYKLVKHIIQAIEQKLSSDYKDTNHYRLVEPFVGSGALFLNTPFKAYLLCDINEDLINLYKTLQTYQDEFIQYTKSFFTQQNNTPDKYYEFRDTFNSSTDIVLKSALFVYLNRHGYNGLVRYNKSGKFNVPFGKYDQPYFPGKEMKYFVHKCKTADVEFKVQDFRDTFKELTEQDIVYCDPPYVPLSDTANFTSYTQEGFSLKDQQDLLTCAKNASIQGIPVVISNHECSFVMNNYDAEITSVDVRRSISCKERKKVKEVLAVFWNNSRTVGDGLWWQKNNIGKI